MYEWNQLHKYQGMMGDITPQRCDKHFRRTVTRDLDRNIIIVTRWDILQWNAQSYYDIITNIGVDKKVGKGVPHQTDSDSKKIVTVSIRGNRQLCSTMTANDTNNTIGTEKKTNIIIDSGSSKHALNDFGLLKDVEEIPPMRAELLDGSVISATRRKVLKVDANGPRLICQAYYIPSLCWDMLSCARMDGFGVTT